MRSVYLIRGDNGKYKIGVAKNPKQRIRQLQTGNSDKLVIIETYKSENATKIESALHNRYSHVRNVGEWFDLSITEEVNFIDSCRRIDESITFLRKMNNVFI
jgi:hypothetical protein